MKEEKQALETKYQSLESKLKELVSKFETSRASSLNKIKQLTSENQNLETKINELSSIESIFLLFFSRDLFFFKKKIK